MSIYTTTLDNPDESHIIGNLFRIQALERRIHELHDKRRENPFLVFSQLGWEVEIEALRWKKDRLEKRTGRMENIQRTTPRLPQWELQRNPEYRTGIKQKSYSERFLNRHELLMLEKQLDEVYERKASILREVARSETGIADARIRNELNELTRKEERLSVEVFEMKINMELENTHTGHQIEISEHGQPTDEKEIPTEIEWQKESFEEEQKELLELEGLREGAQERDEIERDEEDVDR